MLIVCNIGHESALELGDPLHYTPPRIIQQMRAALWSLPLWAAPQWVSEPWYVHPFSRSSSPYLSNREQSHIASYETLPSSTSSIMLWGLERSLLHQLRVHYKTSSSHLAESCEAGIPQSLAECWTRAASVNFFRHYSTVPWRRQVRMISHVEDLAHDLAHGPVLLKLPYSSSGRGLWRIARINSKLEGVLCHLLHKHGSLLIEPFLEKEQDYGAEYYIDKEGRVKFLGLSPFTTDNQGHYLESLCQDPGKTLQQLSDTLQDPDTLHLTLSQHLSFLAREIAPYYRGAVGIDLLTYRSKSGIALHPWVEINLRYTMGHYALDLYRERIPPDSSALYYIGIISSPRANTLLSNQDPPQLDSDGRLHSGLLPLTSTDTSEISHFAYLRRGDDIVEKNGSPLW